MDLSNLLSFASAGVSLAGAGVTLYLGKQAQKHQLDVKRLDVELRQKEERRGRVIRMLQAVQSYRLELFQLRAWLAAYKAGGYLHRTASKRSEKLVSAYEELVNSWSAIEAEVSAQNVRTMSMTFHEDGSVYIALVSLLYFISNESDQSETATAERIDQLKAATVEAVDRLDSLELAIRAAINI